MSARRAFLFAVVVAGLFMVPTVLGASPVSSPHAAPHIVVAAAPATHSISPEPSIASCATPSSTGTWGNPDFFKSVKVQFFVPGDPGLSGSNFNVTPCGNTIPTYVNGFWMNISTDVQIEQAVVTIWGTTWQLPNQNFPNPIQGFSPGPPYDSNAPQQIPMYINAPLFETASFYFNDYKNFWPGSQVYFNVTVTVYNATPAILASSGTHGITGIYPNGTSDLADWQFTVGSPWSSNNFSQDIQVATTPDVLHTPQYDPNPNQPLQITISSIDLGSGTTLSIPVATLYLTVETGPGQAVYSGTFGPANHSVQTLINPQTGLPRPLGPFAPGSIISFNVSAWVPWRGGTIDRIFSPMFTFNWSKEGGWWQPHAPLESNLQLSTDPTGLNGTPQALPTMTPVNVSIHEPIQNVTIGSASVAFQYTDRYGAFSGSIPMIAASYNTSYARIPGLPTGGNITFSVLAKDIFANTIASANYSYFETGAVEIPPVAGTGFLFFEAVDLSTGRLVANLPFKLSNATWTDQGNASVLGFGGILPPAGSGYLPLAYGNYTLTVTAFGSAQTASVRLSSVSGTPVVFYFTTGDLPPLGSVSVSTFSLAAALGIIAAALAVVPIHAWFVERRKKAEAEQKRISL